MSVNVFLWIKLQALFFFLQNIAKCFNRNLVKFKEN
nr:MAG TPA: hypothetical protein [Caudoviricetes sp.]